MKRYRWKMGLLLIVLSVFLTLFPVAAAGENLVYDQAGLLDSSQAEMLKKKAEALREQYQMNFVLLTTNDAQGKEPKEYADDFYMDQGFYNNGEKGGIVLFIDMDHRKVKISTAGDMIYYLTDDRIEDVIDAGYEELKAGEYSLCFSNMMERVSYYMEEGIPSDQFRYDTETGKIIRYRSIRPAEALIAVGIALAAAAAAAVFVVGSYRMKWGTYHYPFREKSSMKLSVKNDRFVNQVVTTRHIPRNPPPTGGGGGGGSMSSTHTSSGGGTFGGGERGF